MFLIFYESTRFVVKYIINGKTAFISCDKTQN